MGINYTLIWVELVEFLDLQLPLWTRKCCRSDLIKWGTSLWCSLLKHGSSVSIHSSFTSHNNLEPWYNCPLSLSPIKLSMHNASLYYCITNNEGEVHFVVDDINVKGRVAFHLQTSFGGEDCNNRYWSQEPSDDRNINLLQSGAISRAWK